MQQKMEALLKWACFRLRRHHKSCFGSGPLGRGYRACMIDSFAFHLAAARVFLPQSFSLACIDAGFVLAVN